MQRPKTHRLILYLLSMLLLLVLPTGAVLAAPTAQTTVGDEDVIRNDIVLFDEDFNLADGGRVKGDIIVFNGDATIAGTVNGDIVLFNGDLIIEPTATLTGDCVLFNGTTSGDGADGFSCENLNVILPAGVANFVTNLTSNGDFGFDMVSDPPMKMDQPSPFSRFVGGTAAAIGRSLLFGLLAFAAASLLPQPMLRIEDALRKKPVASGAVGLLTAFSMPFVVAILGLLSTVLILACGIGLLGFPIIAAMIFGMIAASFLGWFTIGNVVGDFLAQKFNLKNRSQAMTTALGTMAITFVIGFLGAIPFVFGESLIMLLVFFLGLGATALTKLGTRAYPIVAAPAVNSDKITAVLDTLPDKPDSFD